MGKLIEVAVPDIGDFTDVPVIELLVADGDTVDKDQALIVLESDKSTMEVPAPAAGVVRGLKVRVGGKVSRGDAICELETASSGAGGEARGDGTSGPEKPAAAMPAAAASADPAPKGESPHESDGGTPDAAPLSTSGTVAHAGPATRKFARELGVDLSRVKGSGPKGRVVIEDVQQHVKAQMTAPGAAAGAAPATAGIPPIPAQDFSKFGPVDRLCQNAAHAGLQEPVNFVGHRMGGHSVDRRRLIWPVLLANDLCGGDAVQYGHGNVGQDEVERLLLRMVHALQPVDGFRDAMSFRKKHVFQHDTVDLVVFDDQDTPTFGVMVVGSCRGFASLVL